MLNARVDLLLKSFVLAICLDSGALTVCNFESASQKMKRFSIAKQKPYIIIWPWITPTQSWPEFWVLYSANVSITSLFDDV